MLNKQDWAAAKSIFDQAIDLPTAEMSDFLDQACGDNHDLRQSLEDMITGYLCVADKSILSAPQQISEQGVQMHLGCGDRLGKYVLVDTIGQGGMGTVFRARRDDDDVHQDVAIKVIDPARVSPETRRRFQLERRVLATLEHPGITRLIDAGQSADGAAFMVMELVQGQTLDQWCQTQHPGLGQRLNAFLSICEAVSYAHANLVVHRDLKPGNVLITENGQPKLMDFGIAKPLANLPGQINLGETTEARPALTPSYAAPEQFDGGTVGTACDVYALGAMLYYLLTETAPLELAGKSWVEIEQTVQNQAPIKPSQRLADLPAGVIGSNQVRGDLDLIVLKCLQKSPSQRYRSVSDLIADIQRLRQHRPIQARAPGRWYRLQRFLRRNWLPTSATATIVVLTLAFTTVVVKQSTQIAAQRDNAIAERNRAEQVTQFLIDTFKSADPEQALGMKLTAQDILDQGARKIDLELAGDDLLRSRLSATIAEVYISLGDFDGAQTLLTKARRHGSELPNDLDALMGLLEGQALSIDGAPEQAMERLQQAAASAPEGHRIKVDILLQQARVLKMLDQREAAKQQAELARLTAQKISGPQSRDAALAMREHASILASLGLTEDALAAYLAALKMLEMHFSEHHPELAHTHYRLAIAYRQLDQLPAALEHAQRSARAYAKTYGNEHFVLAGAHNLLGTVHKKMGNTDLAIDHYQRSIEISNRVFGPHSRRAAAPTFNLGLLYLDNKQDPTSAVAQLRDAVTIAGQIYGPEHNNYTYMRMSLARALLAANEPKRALEILRETTQYYANRPTARGLNLARSRMLQASAMMAINRKADVSELLQQALRTFEEQRGEQHPDTLQTRALLAQLNP